MPRFLFRHRRLLWIVGGVVTVLLCVIGVWNLGVTYDDSRWSQAREPVQLLRQIAAANRKYAAAHHGNFARTLVELGESDKIEESYKIEYYPSEDVDHAIRHYSVRAVPGPRYWVSVYVDETGIVRVSEKGPADRKSHALGE